MEEQTNRESLRTGKERTTFSVIFAVLALTLLVLPVVSTFNEFLTRIVERSEAYRAIERFIVPAEAKLVGATLLPFGWDVAAYPKGIIVNSLPIYISWNCVGWQSFFLLLLTFATGLSGRYTLRSLTQTLIIGLLGTFLVNIFRISLVAIFAVAFGRLPAVIFHDYFSTVLIVAWLFLYWWVSYRYLLIPKTIPND